MEIGAVYRNFPRNSSFFGFQIMCANPPVYNSEQAKLYVNFETFVLLHEKADTASVGQQLRRMWNDDYRAVRGEDAPFTLELQELSKIHLYSSHITGSVITTHVTGRADLASSGNIDVCLEVGPGNVLQGLWRDFGSDIPCYAAGTVLDIQNYNYTNSPA
jgi:hypothetical protein